MPLIQLDDVYKSFGGNEVLTGITWKVEPRHRIGLVGRNGCGKTTLFHVLTGVETPDRGAVYRSRGLKIAHLPQEPELRSESTVLRSALAGFQDMLDIQGRLRELEDVMASGETRKEVLDEYGHLHDRYEGEGGYTLEARAKAVLDGVGFAESDLDKPVDVLSGGQKNRLALAQLLAKEPDSSCSTSRRTTSICRPWNGWRVIWRVTACDCGRFTRPLFPGSSGHGDYRTRGRGALALCRRLYILL